MIHDVVLPQQTLAKALPSSLHRRLLSYHRVMPELQDLKELKDLRDLQLCFLLNGKESELALQPLWDVREGLAVLNGCETRLENAQCFQLSSRKCMEMHIHRSLQVCMTTHIVSGSQSSALFGARVPLI